MELHLERLTKTFPGGVRAVDDFSLVVPEGALVVLVGPSGCGKTTLLRLVAGLETPSGGRISLSGRDLTTLAPADREVAMVFQDHALYPSRTVHDNLAFPLRVRRLPGAEIAQRVREAAVRLGLEDVLTARPGALSGGQRQRVALGRALVRRPALFLFDEPLSNIDAGLRRQLRQLIKQLQRDSGVSALYVTHDQEEALALADLLVVMDAGRIQQAGPPAEVYQCPANRFVAGFVGPAMNFVEGRLAARDGAIVFEGTFGAVEVGQELGSRVGQMACLGFRPEAGRLGNVVTPGELVLHGRVHLMEYLGGHVDVILQGSQTTWTVRLNAGQGLQLGQEVILSVPLDRCRWFDIDGPAGR
jgi:ABC-type sugar transport system ATPase subunit